MTQLSGKVVSITLGSPSTPDLRDRLSKVPNLDLTLRDLRSSKRTSG